MILVIVGFLVGFAALKVLRAHREMSRGTRPGRLIRIPQDRRYEI